MRDRWRKSSTTSVLSSKWFSKTIAAYNRRNHFNFKGYPKWWQWSHRKPLLYGSSFFVNSFDTSSQSTVAEIVLFSQFSFWGYFLSIFSSDYESDSIGISRETTFLTFFFQIPADILSQSLSTVAQRLCHFYSFYFEATFFQFSRRTTICLSK